MKLKKIELRECGKKERGRVTEVPTHGRIKVRGKIQQS